MLTIECHGRAARLIATLALVSGTAMPLATPAQPAGIDAQAEKLLKASMSFLGSQKKLSADTHSTIELVTRWGQKLQFDNTVTRPSQVSCEPGAVASRARATTRGAETVICAGAVCEVAADTGRRPRRGEKQVASPRP